MRLKKKDKRRNPKKYQRSKNQKFKMQKIKEKKIKERKKDGFGRLVEDMATIGEGLLDL